MAGKHLFSGDRLLRSAASSAGSKSGSDLVDLGEDDIWAVETQSNGQSTGGCETTDDESAVRRRFEAAVKSAPMKVPGGSPAAKGDDDEEWVPPHEYVARVQRRKAVATSVFEGVGRTLKGRDMSRVRDAVWSRTGFFG